MSVARLIVAFVFSCSCSWGAPAVDNTHGDGCIACHATTRQGEDVTTYGDLVSGSVHRGLSCTDCHVSVSGAELVDAGSLRHVGPAGPVDCGECHEDVADIYIQHGRGLVGSHSDVPNCRDCHGTHGISGATDAASATHRSNVSRKCIVCHADDEMAGRNLRLSSEHVSLFSSSIHAQLADRGNSEAATCVDCHGSVGEGGAPSAHLILDAANPESATNYFGIPGTCGACHVETLNEYWQGIHGQLVRSGDFHAPNCTQCHGEHHIAPPSDSKSTVSANNLAIHTCNRCHGSPILAERAGRSDPHLRSFVDPYHGLKRKSGRVHVANCIACHGVHSIRAIDDPQSSVHPSQVRETCSSCHPGISEVRAKMSMHHAMVDEPGSWSHLFAGIYLFVIVLAIGAMLVHDILHWVRHTTKMMSKRSIIRMTVGETIQHWILMISFIGLVVTGFALRFSEAFWVDWLFGWGSGAGFLYRGPLHRFFAVVFLGWSVWHGVYLLTERGRGFLRDMIWSGRDFGLVRENLRYLVGRRAGAPRFGRFTYMEKCEYWALMWGVVIMVGTGVPLWFDDFFIESWGFSLGLLDVLQVVHYYEAWLATLAILVWHVYGVIFSPSVYPMNPAWISGRMPADMYEREHGDRQADDKADAGD